MAGKIKNFQKKNGGKIKVNNLMQENLKNQQQKRLRENQKIQFDVRKNSNFGAKFKNKCLVKIEINTSVGNLKNDRKN